MKKSDNIMTKIAAFIVDKRTAIYIFFAAMIVYSLICIPKVKVNNDITSYLDKNTETRIGLDIMDSEFTTYGSAKIMVSNITYETAEHLAEEISSMDNIKNVDFEEGAEHYKSSAALFNVTFADNGDTEESAAAMEKIKELLSSYDAYISSDIGDNAEEALAQQMSLILAVAAVIIIAVLIFTSQSFAEIIVFLIVFIVAAIINMGTNAWFGEISYITKSIAIVLQLALAIDYAIILVHRFSEEKLEKDNYNAIVAALSKAIIEISSSSLTTISGLVALMLMQLKIGMDMGLVLSKGILCSLITVFLLMPGLLLMMSGLIDKTTHKSFVPSINKWGRFVLKTRFFVPVIFVALITVCAVLSMKSSYSYDADSVKSVKQTERQIAEDKINENFGISSQMAVIVPKGNYEHEGKILNEVMKLDRITSALGLANTELDDGRYMLTDKLTPREFSEFTDIDYELISILYQAYGIKNDNYSAVLNNVDDTRICIIDIVEFIKEEMDKGVITLDAAEEEDFNSLYSDLEDGKSQLEGEEYARLVFEYSGNVEGEESYEFLNEVRKIAEKYYEQPIIVSDTTASYDLCQSFKTDNVKISLLTILFVFVILMFTFRSAGIPILLVLTIQGSIWINFSVPYLTDTRMYFLAYLIVSAIQMGATIDYAIVMTNRYEALKKTMDHKTAVVTAIDEAFPTILTSGSILTMAGFLIGFLASDAVISGLGTALGRGTLTSIILVMIVLPQILILCDTFIDRTYFPERTKSAAVSGNSGNLMKINGRIRGHVNGFIDGEFNGILRGDTSIELRTASDNTMENYSEPLTEKGADKNEEL